MLESANTPRERLLIALIAFAGLRVSEAVSLKRADVSFSPPEITVRRGKGGRSRAITIYQQLKPHLRSYLDDTRGGAAEDFLFPSYNGHLTSRWAQRIVQLVGQRAGLRNVTPNDLRRACVLYWHYRLGLQPTQVQEHLGVAGADFLDILEQGAAQWALQPDTTDEAEALPSPIYLGPGRPPRNQVRDQELWDMIRIHGKTFGEAARDYSHAHSIQPPLTRDRVRMAVIRFENKLIKEALKAGARDLATIATRARVPIERVSRVIGSPNLTITDP